MDYSLLLGIHYQSREDPDFLGKPIPRSRKKKLLEAAQNIPNSNLSSASSSIHPYIPNVRKRGLISRAAKSKMDSSLSRSKAGMTNLSVFQQDDGGINAIDEIEEVEREEIYFVGVIDILQKWNLRKQLERIGKGIREDRDGLSAAPPAFYASRFREFLEKVTI